MNLTILDFPDYRKLITTLNGIITRPQLTDLLRIYSLIDKVRTPRDKVRINALKELMDKNLADKKPLLLYPKDYSVTRIYVKASSLELDNPKLNKNMLEAINLMNTNELSEYLSFEGDTPIVITRNDALQPTTYKDIYQIIKIAKRYKQVGYLKGTTWVNISGSNIFKGDLITEEQEVLNVMKNYYVPGANTLYSNFKIADFCGANDVVPTSVYVNSDYYKIQLLYNLESGTSDLPVSMVNKLNGSMIDIIVKKSFLDTYLKDELPGYNDIVWVNENRESSTRWISKFVIANKMYEGKFTLKHCIAWPDNSINSIIYMLRNTIARVDHVWIAATKGIGKSTLTKRLTEQDNEWLIIDSDVKGKLLYVISKSSELQQDCKDGNYTSPGLVNALYDVIMATNEIESLYELAASEYCAHHSIDVEMILKNKMGSLYHSFINVYNVCSKPLPSDKNGWFKLCGCILPFHNLRLTMSNYPDKKPLKVLQFVHNANELYGAMSDAVFTLESTINTMPIHLRRERGSKVTQMFLANFYEYTNTFTTTPINLHILSKALLKEY